MAHLHFLASWQGMVFPRSRAYGAAAYLSCVSKESFVNQTLKGIGLREKATRVLRIFKLVGKRRWGLWKDLFVLRTCLALHPYLKALLCSCSHCFALSCWRDAEAVHSIVLGWESGREKYFIQDGAKWKSLHWGHEGIWALVCWSKLISSVLNLKLIQSQKWPFFLNLVCWKMIRPDETSLRNI